MQTEVGAGRPAAPLDGDRGRSPRRDGPSDRGRSPGRRAEDRQLEEVRAELEGSDRRFRQAWEHAPIGMVMVGLDGEWWDANAALCRLLGRSREELRGHVVDRITHPDDLDASVELLRSALRAGQDHFELTKRYLTPDGTEVPVQITVSLISDEDGSPSYVLGQIVDLTAVRRAEERLGQTIDELQRSNQALRSFAEIASHDLTSPLGTSRSLVELVLEHHGDGLSPTVVDVLERAARQASRALASTHALLDLASVGEPTLEREIIPLDELLDGVVDGLAEEVGAVGGTIDVEVGCAVVGDRARLELVFQNLLSNAIKFRHPVRPLQVRVHCASGAAEREVHVDDNGRGLEPGDEDRLFGFGVQGEAGQQAGGLGLGLATCRRIVEEHGGSIGVSARPEGGTRVSVVLPHQTVSPPGG